MSDRVFGKPGVGNTSLMLVALETAKRQNFSFQDTAQSDIFTDVAARDKTFLPVIGCPGHRMSLEFP